jgi:CHAT domain-containing protein
MQDALAARFYKPGRRDAAATRFGRSMARSLNQHVGGCIMTQVTRRWLWLLVFALGFQPTGLAQTESRTPQPVPAQSLDVTALAAAVIGAKTGEERAALLAAHKGLITPALRSVLASKAFHLGLKGDYPQGLAVLSSLQEIGERNHDKAWIAISMIDSTVIYYLQGNLLKALESYRKVPPLADIEYDKQALAHVLSIRGFLGYFRKGYAKALLDCQKSLALSEAADDKDEIAFTLDTMGLMSSAQQNYTQAIEYYQKSLKICEVLGDRILSAIPLNNMGIAYHEQGEEELALKYYRQSLALSRELGIKSLVHYTLNNIGSAYAAQGANSNAIEYFQQALTLRKALGNKEEIAVSLGGIGNAHQTMGNYSAALENLRLSLALYEEVSNKPGVAVRLHDIGSIYNAQGNFAQALEYFQKSLGIWEALEDKQGIAGNLEGIGSIHLNQGNPRLALQYLQRSLAIYETLGHKEWIAGAVRVIGTAYDAQGEHTLASEYLYRSLDMAEETRQTQYIGAALVTLGWFNLNQSKYDKAEEHFQRALSMAEGARDKLPLIAPLEGLADLRYARGDYQHSLELAERAIVLYRELDGREPPWALNTMGKAYRALNQLQKARRAFDDVINAIETGRTQVAGAEQDQQRYFENTVGPYYEMVELLISQNNPGEALAYAERAKARVLLDVLQRGKVDIAKAMTAGEQQQERKLDNDMVSLNAQISHETLRRQADATRLADLKGQLQKARLSYEDFQTNLYAAHPALKVQRGSMPSIRLEDTRALLPDTKTALVEYAVTDNQTYLFVLNKIGNGNSARTNLKAYKLAIGRDQLALQCEKFREQLAAHSLDFRQPAARLYDLLLKPAEAQLHDKTRLVIVPDGALWSLPFQALQPDENHYVMEDYAISYAPSLTVLGEVIKLRRKRQGNQQASETLFAVGNPTVEKETVERVKILHRDESLDPLPEAETEVKSLGRLYGEARSRIYVGAQATEERVKAEAANFGIVHLATHAILNDGSPMYSQVVLSQSDKPDSEDGLLEAWEIMKLNLKADLVVLSACETARGRVGAGEGVIGLTWALFVAGCPTAVVSQWKVESPSTAVLMIEFHRNLRLGIGKAEALRRASLKLLRTGEYQHPVYWAAFVVVGDGFQ